MKFFSHSIKTFLIFLFAVSLWQCDDDPASPTYNTEDLVGHWIINSMQGKGQVNMSMTYSIGLFDTTMDTTMYIDTMITLSGDSNYSIFYSDNTYKQSIDSSAYPDFSDMFSETSMYKNNSFQLINAAYVKDTGSWTINGNTLICSSYTDGHVLEQSIGVSGNSLTATQVMDTSISVSDDGLSTDINANIRISTKATKSE